MPSLLPKTALSFCFIYTFSSNRLQNYNFFLTFAPKLKDIMKKFSHLIKNYPLTLLCLSLIWFLSLFVVVPQTPLNDVAFIDKWTHLVMYGGTCSVIWFEYLRHHERLVFWKLFLYAWLGPILMSGLIELIQPYFNRYGEWLDFAANSTGATLAVGIGLLMNRIKQARHKKSDATD